MSNLEEALLETKKLVDERLAKLFNLRNQPEDRVLEAMNYAANAGGKRIRAFLVVESAKLFDIPKAWALDIAVALECVHSYSLIHDDLPAMDNDDLRRGKPTVHKKFDEATAILAGDGLLTKAFEIMADIEYMPSNIKAALISKLAQCAGAESGMVAGQMLDILLENKEFDKESVMRMQSFKTGALFEFALTSGAIMAKLEDDRGPALAEYGKAMGLLFQITDDILDEEGDEELVGKKLHKDKDAGKANWVSLVGVEQSKKDAKRLVEEGKAVLRIFGEDGKMLCDLLDYTEARKF